MIDNKHQNLSNLLERIYNQEECLDCLEDYSPFLKDLKKYTFSEILACQRDYPLRYVLNFILSIPSLWMNLSDVEWINIMSTLNPRPLPFSREIDNTGYVDIHFLCRYMKINAIDTFLNQEDININDKKNLLAYAKKISEFLFLSELDIEDLDGSYLVSIDKINEVRNKIIAAGKFKPFEFTLEELQDYINIKLRVIED
jgi:hypothetical protein